MEITSPLTTAAKAKAAPKKAAAKAAPKKKAAAAKK